MGRIKGRKPEETREAVLGAATRAFAERGFSNATLGLIASRAGVTAATLPYHFGDKQGLYDAVIEKIYRDLMAFSAELTTSGDFRQLIDDIYRWAESHRDGMRVLLRAVVESGGLDWQVRELRMGPLLSFVSGRMAKQFGVGEQNARRALVALTHLVMRFATNSMDDNQVALGQPSHERTRDEIVDIVTAVGQHLLGLPEA